MGFPRGPLFLLLGAAAWFEVVPGFETIVEYTDWRMSETSSSLLDTEPRLIIEQGAAARIAAIAEPVRGLYGVQFHPEVVHTTHGKEILSNFVFGVCGCTADWDPRHRIPQIEAEIRERVGERPDELTRIVH